MRMTFFIFALLIACVFICSCDGELVWVRLKPVQEIHSRLPLNPNNTTRVKIGTAPIKPSDSHFDNSTASQVRTEQSTLSEV